MSEILSLSRFLVDYWRRSLRPASPRFIWLEPTNACNLNCVICSRNQAKRPCGFMSTGLFIRLKEEIVHVRPALVTRHLAGEPLLHPGLPWMIRELAGSGIHTTLSTNGTLLDGDMARELVGSGLESVRIDFAPDAEKFEFARRGAKWTDVRNGIKTLLAARRSLASAHPKIFLNCIRFSETPRDDDLSRLASVFADNPADGYEMFKAHSWAGEFALRQKDDPVYRVSVERLRYSPCSLLWNSLAICWDGRVVPCCRDLNAEHVIGDASMESLESIWHGEASCAIRQSHARRKACEVQLCRACTRPYEKTGIGNVALKLAKVRIEAMRRAVRRPGKAL